MLIKLLVSMVQIQFFQQSHQQVVVEVVVILQLVELEVLAVAEEAVDLLLVQTFTQDPQETLLL